MENQFLRLSEDGVFAWWENDACCFRIIELFLQAAAPGTAAYHLQRALPGGIVLMELAFQVS